MIIAGGGTGGHIFPAIAIANALKQERPDMEFLFVGANGKMEMERVPQAGYKIRGIDIAGFNRSSLLKNIGLPFKLVKSFLQVRTIFKEFRPDAVLGVGGYSTFPVLKYAQSKGIPTFIHESNSHAGRSNILLGKGAVKVFTGSSGMEKFFPAEKIMVTGNPVRKDIIDSAVSKRDALKFFSLDEGKLTLLVLGGSLGARSINEAVAAHIDKLIHAGLQVIWQTGRTCNREAIDISVEHKEVWANDFITNMEYAYAAADIIMARAGAMTVAEICIVKKPAVLVPFPYAAEDHQTANAMQLVNNHAALMVKDSDARNEAINQVLDLAGNESLRATMSANLGKMAITDAGKRVAGEILRILG